MMDLFIFDLGGVLVNSFDIIPEAARRLDIPEDRLRTLIRPDMEPYMSGRIDFDEFWDRFFARTGIRAPENYWATLFHPVRDLAVEGLARALKPRGRVVCGTNTIDVHFDALEAEGHYDCFDAVYASHFLGVSKPHPDFWLRILESEGRTAGDVFFIDDMEENVHAARNLGIRSHLFTDASGLAAALEDAGFPVRAGARRP